MKIALVGRSGCGKDTGALHLASISSLRFARSTSQVITPIVAARLGLTQSEAFARRHEPEIKAMYRRTGDEMRMNDPTRLAQECLKDGDILVRCCTRPEIQQVRACRLVDVIIWIDRDVPPDSTLEFSAEEADIIVQNRGSLAEFHAKLKVLARSWGVYNKPTPGNVVDIP